MLLFYDMVVNCENIKALYNNLCEIFFEKEKSFRKYLTYQMEFSLQRSYNKNKLNSNVFL